MRLNRVAAVRVGANLFGCRFSYKCRCVWGVGEAGYLGRGHSLCTPATSTLVRHWHNAAANVGGYAAHSMCYADDDDDDDGDVNGGGWGGFQGDSTCINALTRNTHADTHSHTRRRSTCAGRM